jgi:hypothetical protein
MDKKRIRPIDASILETHPNDVHPAKGMLPIRPQPGENTDANPVVVKIHGKQLVQWEPLPGSPPSAKSLKKRHC